MTKSTVTQDEHEVVRINRSLSHAHRRTTVARPHGRRWEGSRSGTFIPLFPFGTSVRAMNDQQRQATKSHRERDGEAGQNMTESCESQFSVKVGTITPPPEPSYEPLTKHCRFGGSWSMEQSKSNKKYPYGLPESFLYHLP
ncbi:hypothetical protein CTAM01_10181 [Colletotrichum tamarilloi]|uniref:Uncharacterized protein n=1 Tax=Colletotrichum tamarilloi TaxID=1209934 RepID=A0ABQ9R177_9PEZI|nr:uncharacterized protein CTAM01_10181 [Colletotrichum tamarilloi]KAK1491858.1 hypothetical protein CTAM01_10181 [Colletotrichum tamarilloi]